MSKYQITVNQSGAQSSSVVGDYTQLVANFTPASSAEDFLTMLKAIREELDGMDIPPDAREEAAHEVERAIKQTRNDPADRPKLADMLKKVGEIVKQPASIALGVGKFWTLLRKALEWLG